MTTSAFILAFVSLRHHPTAALLTDTGSPPSARFSPLRGAQRGTGGDCACLKGPPSCWPKASPGAGTTESHLKREAPAAAGLWNVLGHAVLCLKAAVPVTQFHGVVSAMTVVISQSSSLLIIFHTWFCDLLANLKATQYTVNKSLCYIISPSLFLLFATKHPVWFSPHFLFLLKPVQERIKNLLLLRHRNTVSRSSKALLLTIFFLRYALSHLI